MEAGAWHASFVARASGMTLILTTANVIGWLVPGRYQP
jgi:hypothetical protein